MGTLKIVYSQLDDVSSNARDVARKCDEYYDDLHSKCVKAFETLTESPLSEKNRRTDSANYYIRQKRKKLEQKKESFIRFANDIDKFKESTQEADARVAKSVNDSQKKFYEAHPNLSGDGWAAFFATISVDCPILGFLIDTYDKIDDLDNNIRNKLRHWYEIEGGKEFIDTALAIGKVLVEALGLVIAVCALFTGPIGIVAIAALVGAAIGLADSIVNLGYQLNANGQKDPAWANYYGGIDDSATALRKQTFDTKLGNQISNGVALGLDVTSTVCSMIDLADGAQKIYKSSGLNKLFETAEDIDGEMIKKFDFAKMKSVLGSSDGRSSVKKTLKSNWKRIVFGHDTGTAKQQWTRAFFSKDPELPKKYRNVGDYSSLSVDAMKNITAFNRKNKATRISKIASVFKGTISNVNTGVEILESGVKSVAMGNHDVYGQLERITSYAHKSDGTIQYANKIYHFVDELVG